jgi:hypothetical protein
VVSGDFKKGLFPLAIHCLLLASNQFHICDRNI